MGLLGSLLSSGAGVLGNLLSNALGGLFNRLQQLPGQLLGFLRGLLGQVFGALNIGLRTALVGLGVVVGGLVVAFRSAIQGANELGKAALSIRASTGASYGSAGRLIGRGLAFGMSPGETASNFAGRNPLTSGFFGNDYRSGNYYSNLSSQYNAGINSGPLGFLMTRNLLKAQGATDADLNIAAMSPDKVRGQEQWSSNIGQKLGITGKAVQDAAEGLFLGMSKLGTIFELVRLKLWSAIGPQVISGIEQFAGLLTRNADRIANVLEKVGGTLSKVFLRGLEIAINYLDKNAGKIQGFIETAFHWVLFDFPRHAMSAGALAAKGMSILLDALSIGVQGLVSIAPVASTFFNDVTKSFIQNIPNILQGLDVIYNGFVGLLGKIAALFPGVSIPGASASGTASKSPSASPKNTTNLGTQTQPGFWGGLWPRLGGAAYGAFKGFSLGAAGGAATGTIIGGGIGGVVGGVVGAGAGGVGALPGIVGGAGAGAGIGRTIGIFGGGLLGALSGAYTGYMGVNTAQQVVGVGGVGPNGKPIPPRQGLKLNLPASNLAGNPQLQQLLAAAATGGNGILQGALGGIQKYGPDLAKMLNSGSTNAWNLSETLQNNSDNWQGTLVDLMKESNQKLGGIEKNTKGQSDMINKIGLNQNILGGVLSDYSQDLARAQRSS